MPTLETRHVVTCFLRNRGDVLLLRRSEAVGSYRGMWGGVAGYAEGDPEAAAWREIKEETGLHEECTPVRAGEPFNVEDANLGIRWRVRPFLFDCARREVRIDWETTEAAWVAPPEMLRRKTVPQLWTSYQHVAPTVETIRSDAVHGAAYLSLRALEVLRDRGGVLAERGAPAYEAAEELRALARALCGARPAMAVVRNRLNRVMHACREDGRPEAVEEAAQRAVGQAVEADAEAARRAAGYVAGRRVLTLSRSGTLLEALLQADPPPEVYVAVSEPGREGIGVAETLDRAGLAVTLFPDAALAAVVEAQRVDVVLVGADTVLPDGSVFNKVGTHVAALAARTRLLPFYAAAASDKVTTDPDAVLAPNETATSYAGTERVETFAPRFEATPARLLSGVITEFGLLAPADLRDLAYELQGLEAW